METCMESPRPTLEDEASQAHMKKMKYRMVDFPAPDDVWSLTDLQSFKVLSCFMLSSS